MLIFYFHRYFFTQRRQHCFFRHVYFISLMIDHKHLSNSPGGRWSTSDSVKLMIQYIIVLSSVRFRFQLSFIWKYEMHSLSIVNNENRKKEFDQNHDHGTLMHPHFSLYLASTSNLNRGICPMIEKYFLMLHMTAATIYR